jgi:hypothetical protein
VLFALALLGGCERLNPSWCEEHASCTVDEVCDPLTNTCRPRDLAVADGPVDARLADISSDAGPPDGAPAQDSPSPRDAAPETTSDTLLDTSTPDSTAADLDAE